MSLNAFSPILTLVYAVPPSPKYVNEFTSSVKILNRHFVCIGNVLISSSMNFSFSIISASIYFALIEASSIFSNNIFSNFLPKKSVL